MPSLVSPHFLIGVVGGSVGKAQWTFELQETKEAGEPSFLPSKGLRLDSFFFYY